MNSYVRLFPKTRRGSWCTTAVKCKALRKVPLTVTAQFKLADDGGNHDMESKTGFDFEDRGFSPSCVVMRDNNFFPYLMRSQ